MFRNAIFRPIVGCSHDKAQATAKLAMHVVRRNFWPAMQQENVRRQGISIADPVDRPKVNLDVRVQGVKARQRREKNVVSELRMRSNGEHSAGVFAETFEQALGMTQFLEFPEQRVAAIKVFAAAGSQANSASSPLKQGLTQAAFERANELLYGGYADFQPLGSPCKAALFS